MFERFNPEGGSPGMEEVEKFVKSEEERLKRQLEIDPVTDEKIDKAALQGSAKEEQGM